MLSRGLGVVPRDAKTLCAPWVMSQEVWLPRSPAEGALQPRLSLGYQRCFSGETEGEAEESPNWRDSHTLDRTGNERVLWFPRVWTAGALNSGLWASRGSFAPLCQAPWHSCPRGGPFRGELRGQTAAPGWCYLGGWCGTQEARGKDPYPFGGSGRCSQEVVLSPAGEDRRRGAVPIFRAETG